MMYFGDYSFSVAFVKFSLVMGLKQMNFQPAPMQ